MSKEQKKTFKMPIEADAKGEIGMQNSVKSGQLFDVEEELSGDSVNEHNQLEAFNEDQAEKEIGQINNNS
ncbi:hypothetical protein [Halobacillus massiliensis]|uniref:hypothetical protein n=1 Tax=Halobacillus massiliensis TaxID=1926286 RepID=UPI0009E32C95|nr:hypothetical protein [Halobacillus massiliensis]